MRKDDDRGGGTTTLVPPPLLLTQALYGDEMTSAVFSPAATVGAWLEVEAALAAAQAQVGILREEEAAAIGRACVLENIDMDRLWVEARTVGYPILPLVRMITAALPPDVQGRVHLGATTQDIMDTGLVLQLRSAVDRIRDLLSVVGDHLARLVEEHQLTPMAARTHGQQAVPTTFGAKLATYLAECGHHLDRLASARTSLLHVSLHGAGGTSAALGPRASDVRNEVARRLGLAATEVPWHVSRHGLAELTAVLAAVTATAVRLAREIATLASTEVKELSEESGHHRGASSTMPQKANPITCEAIIGLGVTCQASATTMYRAMEAQHERATGEWQVEMVALPQAVTLGAGCLLRTGDLLAGLTVDTEQMERNLALDDGLIMAEAYMIGLAPQLGREHAHDLVYAACREVRRTHTPLADVVRRLLSDAQVDLRLVARLDERGYLGHASKACSAAREQWHTTRARHPV